MGWLMVALVPPVLWALVNHIDKYLLTRTRHSSSVDVLMVYSTSFSFIVLPVLYLFFDSTIFVSAFHLVIQIFGGLLLSSSIYFYLKALDRDDASVVVPFALLAPVFGFVLSYVFLGETVSLAQLFSCAVILVGALLLSLEFSEDRRIKLKKEVVLYMVACVVLQTSQEVLFKFVTIDNTILSSFFWLHVGIAIFGVLLLLLKAGTLSSFLVSLKLNGKSIFLVNVASEGVSTVAYMVRNFSLLLASVGIVMTINGFQPAFVFIFGIVFTLILPGFVKEKISLKHLLHKGTAICLMIFGVIMIATLA